MSYVTKSFLRKVEVDMKVETWFLMHWGLSILPILNLKVKFWGCSWDYISEIWSNFRKHWPNHPYLNGLLDTFWFEIKSGWYFLAYFSESGEIFCWKGGQTMPFKHFHVKKCKEVCSRIRKFFFSQNLDLNRFRKGIKLQSLSLTHLFRIKSANQYNAVVTGYCMRAPHKNCHQSEMSWEPFWRCWARSYLSKNSNLNESKTNKRWKEWEEPQLQESNKWALCSNTSGTRLLVLGTPHQPTAFNFIEFSFQHYLTRFQRFALELEVKYGIISQYRIAGMGSRAALETGFTP